MNPSASTWGLFRARLAKLVPTSSSFAKWEFSARYHMTASDLESWTIKDILALDSREPKPVFEDLWLGYTEVRGGLDLF